MGGHPAVGAQISKYQLVAELGQGGMATVYLAVMRGIVGFDKLLVVKLLKPEIAENTEELAMFLDEARLAARLNHPNVVQSIELGEEDGRYFIAMEYLDGQPFTNLTRSANRADALDTRAQLYVLAEILSGLHYAHELRDFAGKPLETVHRDVSPHNVFVTYDGIVKLLDFGIAKAAWSKPTTGSGEIKGKVGYMAPEQLSEERYDRRVDVFAVGAMVWEALAGHRLWKGVSDVDILRRLMEGDIPSLAEARPDAHERAKAICARALAPEPDARYPTALELRKDLLEYLAETGSSVGAAQLTEYLTAHFGEERERIRSIVEKQLGELETQDTSRSFADLPKLGRESTRSGSRRDALPGRTGTTSGTALDSELRPGATAGRSKWVFAGAVVVAGAMALALAGRGRGAAPAPTAAPATSGAVPPTETQTVSVQIGARPPATKLFLDDWALEKNPYHGRVSSDTKPHRVRFEADGFETRVETVSLAKDLLLQVDLVPLAPAAAASAASSAVAPRAPVGGKLPGAKPPTTSRPIDERNPFK